MQFPERHNNHTLEQKSETFFRQHLPQDWNVTAPSKDYGQDLNLEICEEGQYRGLDLIVQLKSSATSDILNDTERQQLKVSTYNYLWSNVRVVLIVKYIEDEGEAYWILLKDVKPPSTSNQESFTIYFPRQNKISCINWDEVTDYVREVTDQKLAAKRVSDALKKLKEEIEQTKKELNREKDTLTQLHSELKIKFSGDWDNAPYPAQIFSPVNGLQFLLFRNSKNQHPQIEFYGTEQYQFTTIDSSNAEFSCRQGVKPGGHPLGQDIEILLNYDTINFFIPFILYDNIKNSTITIKEIEIIIHINGKITKRLFHQAEFVADVKIYNNNKSQGWASVAFGSPLGIIMNEFTDI